MKHNLTLIATFLYCTAFSQLTDTLDFTVLFTTQAGDSVSCYRIPSLITAKNGTLIAAIDERVPSCADLRGSNDINIVIRRSSDNGNTWSDIETLVDYPSGKSASDPSMILDKLSGEVFLFYNYMDLNKAKDIYFLKVISSRDHGKTWSTARDITAQISKPEWHNDFKFITSGRGLQTSSGTLIHTLVNLESGLHLFKSDDHGQSWQLIDSPITPGDESKVLELNDGSLMVNSRVNNASARYVHLSSDRGQSWHSYPDSQLVDPACNASLIRYSSITNGSDKDRLLFVNCNSKHSRENLTVKISYDEGKTWSQGRSIYSGSAAYSSMTILQNGEIGVFFEKDDYSENAFARFSLDWLTYGQDQGESNRQ